VNMPDEVNEGDHLVVILNTHSAGGTDVAFTPPAGWTVAAAAVNTSSGRQELHAFSKAFADGTEDGGTATWTAAPAARGSAYALAVSGSPGVVAVSPQSDFATSTSALARPHGFGGTIQTLMLAVVGMFDDDATATSFPSGWTYFTANQGSGGGTNASASIAIASRRSGTAPSVTPGAFTLSETEGWLAFTLAIPAAHPDVEPAPGVYFVAEGEASVLDGTWSTATASTCRLLVEADHIGLRVGDELETLIASDLEEPTFPGYATTALTGAGWTVTPGTPTVATHTDRVFTLSGAPVDPVVVEGLFVTRNSDGALIYFEIFDPDAGPFVLEQAGDQITVSPTYTVKGVRPA
ncbi:MAG TPA: hypothetical protein VF228_10260, partial [Iamia sp.]